MNKTKDIIASGSLDAASIDQLSEAVAQYYESHHANTRDILKLRLSAEEVMGVWAAELGENATCRLLKNERFGRAELILQADGRSVDPTRYRDELLLSVSSNLNIVAVLGLPAEYSYTGGTNVLQLRMPAKKVSSIGRVIIAVLAAVILGFGARYLIPDTAAAITSGLFTPLSDTMMNLLRLIAGPVVFLSVVAGINGMGDTASVGRIGISLTRRIFLKTLLVSILSWLAVLWLFPPSLSGNTGGAESASSILSIVLSIVPNNIITPFETGNALQIIFMAVCFGLAGLILGDRTAAVTRTINQLDVLVRYLMTGISKLMPVYIFLCIAGLIMSSNVSQLSQVIVPLMLIAVFSLLMPLIYILVAAISCKMPYGKILRSILPTYLIALTTASSPAALESDAECCEKKLHISEKLVRFGVAFGQVLFKPGCVMVGNILTLTMAKLNGIEMSPSWIITLLLVGTILTIATPPVPGGQISTLIILFTQLGIPTEDMAICVAIISFTDYVVTSCNVACLPPELLLAAKKLGLLNRDNGAEQ